MSDDNAAVALGYTLGLFARHGAPTIASAVSACRAGIATPQQQRIVAALVDAAAGQKP